MGGDVGVVKVPVERCGSGGADRVVAGSPATCVDVLGDCKTYASVEDRKAERRGGTHSRDLES